MTRRLSHPVVSSHPSRASARKRANTLAETNAETNPGPPKTRNRPYDNRPRSGPVRAARRAPQEEQAIRVILPDEPPRLTPGAAAALLRILLKAHDQMTRDEQGIDR
jgi:hypothetical protein